MACMMKGDLPAGADRAGHPLRLSGLQWLRDQRRNGPAAPGAARLGPKAVFLYGEARAI